ncbi:hypothetical protein [Halomarina oriensis]|uniref:Uncharacterized protein n=1 Tax=Halomarina oriensis TaxID=671145 RepID=A0A6B0GML4_9EURY|nr:hypothetical protein [Halomarina oriensis]MWG36102.1 hypothetical protein [Halomarina oriensis]
MTDPPDTHRPTLAEFIGTRDSFLVVQDPQLAKSGTQARAQLRSLPLLTKFGLEAVAHPGIYDNGLRLVEYEMTANESLRENGVGDVAFPLVHYVSQEMLTGELQDENRTYDDQDIVRQLLRIRPEGVPYVLVTDTNTPMMPRHTKKPGKSFVDEFECTVVDHKALLKQYLQYNFETDLSLSTTQNLYFHNVSAHHKAAGLDAGSIPKLFDYTKIPADSPAWEPLYYLIREDVDNVLEDYSERIREALRSWTERGPTQQVANRMLDMLELIEFEEPRLDNYRYRHQGDI